MTDSVGSNPTLSATNLLFLLDAHIENRVRYEYR